MPSGAVCALGIAVAALAQGFDLRSLFTQLGAPAQSPAGGRPRRRRAEWSGEPGASGHPLMTADAIRAAAADFRNCLEGLWPVAARRGISRASFEATPRGSTPDLRIMDLLDAQPEFTKAFWDYLDMLVTDERIANGRAMLAQHAAIFDAVEKAYGVDRHIIAAIWGVEIEIRHAWSATGR